MFVFNVFQAISLSLELTKVDRGVFIEVVGFAGKGCSYLWLKFPEMEV